MILTNCAACAAPLAHDAPRCVRCWTRYCDAACQHDHWRRGHKQICKTIHRGGNAEQYYADKKYKEAVAVAVEACADDTKGQKCYICLEAVHPRTGEGLVRGCACGDRDGVASGSTGIAHVSCLAEQAKILVEEAEENKLGYEAWNERSRRWYACGLCEQHYHGVVACALGWACWKTYLGRPEEDRGRRTAMTYLGNGLKKAAHYEAALSVGEAELAMERRRGGSESDILVVQGNLANSYQMLGRHEETLALRRDVYSRTVKLEGEESKNSLREAGNLALSLGILQHFAEAKAHLRKMIPVARRVLGETYETTLRMRSQYARVLYADPDATLDDIREAVTMLEETERAACHVLGPSHPISIGIGRDLKNVRGGLRIRKWGALVLAVAIAAVAWVFGAGK